MSSDPGQAPYPWPAAVATGVGSMPGTDPAESVAVVLGEVPDLPFLPELPARGPGADLIGRTAALLVDLPVETTTRGWKLATRPGRAQRRAAGLLSADLDALQEAAEDYAGPVKAAVCGPWTLAATIELNRSQNPALADEGAIGDLTASLAEAVAAHVAQLRARLPRATLLLQVDEPALPAVLAGEVPTASGLNRVRAIEPGPARDMLTAVLAAAGSWPVVHCCAAGVPFTLLREAGAAAVSFDPARLSRGDEDGVAEIAEGGTGLLLGVLPTASPGRLSAASLPDPRDTAAVAITLWHRMGLPPASLASQVVLTPACGLAGASPSAARAAIGHCRQAAALLPELIEEGVR